MIELIAMDDLDLGLTLKGLSAGQKVFGRYELTRILGLGGMGVVWLAWDHELEQELALKFLSDLVVHDKRALNGLRQETRRSRELTHPNIVRIHDIVRDERMAAISMEYVKGHTLADLQLERPGRVFQVDELAPWVKQLCEALDYAHKRAKIVHRDLKPANLMVTSAGDLKITDFGISASVADSATRVSRTFNTKGTPVYMGPQQMMGEKPSVSDDVYAIGATLYELLTGNPPFYSGNVILQVHSKVPPPAGVRRAEAEVPGAAIPQNWEDTIAACLAKNAEERPASAREVGQRLGLIEADSDGAVPPLEIPAAGEPARPARKRLWRWATAGGLIVAAGLAYYFGSYQPEQKRRVDQQLAQEAAVQRQALEQARVAAETKQREAQSAAAEAARVAAAKAARLSELEAVSQAKGGIWVRTEPVGAQVRIGGIALDNSPYTLKEVKAGQYPVRATLDGYQEYDGSVTVKENEFAEVNVTLTRLRGDALIDSVPSGLPYVVSGKDGNWRGVTPAHLEKLPTGAYSVTISRRGWADERRTLDVHAGQVASARVELTGGTLELASTPAGAEVWSAGRRLGITPLRMTDQPPGQWPIEFRLKGYGTVASAAEVRPNRTTPVSTVLSKVLAPKEGESWSLPDLNLALIYVKPGRFIMGSPDTEIGHNSDEAPRTPVTLSRGFWLGKFPVTQGEYQTLAGANPSRSKGGGLQAPVDSVSWDQAMQFCRKLTDRERAAQRLPTGWQYSLPTEAQWEYACRAGASSAYYLGDQEGDLDRAGWHSSTAGNTSHPVGQKEPNAWGLYDMLGSICQWCRDFYGPYPGRPVTDPMGPYSGESHPLRGGSWSFVPQFCRCAYRFSDLPDASSDYTGFRVALVPIK